MMFSEQAMSSSVSYHGARTEGWGEERGKKINR